MPIHDRLLWYVLGAAVAGLLVPHAAALLYDFVPLMLAGQVAGVSLTLPAREFTQVARRIWLPVAALAVQWICFPLFGLLLLHLGSEGTVGRGALIIAVAPAEITSALIAILAGADGSLAVVCMASSLALSTVLTPLWLAVALGANGRVDERSLVAELVLSVTVPLCLGVILRTARPAIQRYRSWFLDLAAVSVLLVIFVGAGSVRQYLHPATVGEALVVCVLLIVAGWALGSMAGVILRTTAMERRALMFPVGMREFGVASAVALVVAPASMGIAGLYGVLVMAASSALAARLRRRENPS